MAYIYPNAPLKMHSKTLIILLLLVGGAMPSFAIKGRNNLQDSIKRVTIKITATEKPRVLNFDSLLQDSQTAKTIRTEKPKGIRKSFAGNGSYYKKEASTNQTKTTPAALQKSAVKPILKAGQNTIAGKTQAVDNKPSFAKNKQQIEETQLVSDRTEVDESTIKTSRTYLWVGFMLIIVGIILGILFGKNALLISLAGLVFVAIGYLINH